LRSLALALAVTLGGCSASELVQNLPAAPAPDLSQPNHRRVVANNIMVLFPKGTPAGEVQISGIRLIDHLKGPAWLTCVKVETQATPQLYAVFIQGDKIIETRVALVIDQCYKDTYEPFEIAAFATKPPPKPGTPVATGNR
jgi:hypothetical protein